MKRKYLNTRNTAIIRIYVLLAVLCCISVAPVFADTGTFKIKNYAVDITPQPDGSWIADYRQEWEVLSGTIPWVTVGLPTKDYEVTQWTGAATKVRPDNQGAWSGVYVQLDGDYRKGESFDFGFTVTQRKMGYLKQDSHVEFSFTPGWYDNSEIERMVITLRNPWSSQDLKFTSPDAYETTADKVVWVSRLGPGQRFKVSFAFSPEVFTALERSPKGGLRDDYGTLGDNDVPPVIGLIIVFIVVLVLLTFFSAVIRNRQRYYRGRRGIYYGTPRPFGSPIIVASGSKKGEQAGKSSGTSSKKSGSGGGGFGGRSSGCHCVSCACACVSCACACACAGGRGAGCAQKFSRLDKQDRKDDAGRKDDAERVDMA